MLALGMTELKVEATKKHYQRLAEYGKALRQWRKENNKSLEQLATMTGVTRQTLWSIEQGEKFPGILLCKALHKITGIKGYVTVKGYDIFWYPKKKGD